LLQSKLVHANTAVVADETNEFKKSLKLERGLDAKMKVLVNKVKRNKEMSEYDKRLMRDAIRNSVQRVYVVGADYAANFLQRDFIMTQTDIENIKALSNEFNDRMQWRIDNYVLNRPVEAKEITTNFITNTFVSYVAPRTMSVATREKTKQILSSQEHTRQSKDVFQLATATASAEAAASSNEENLPPVVLKWVTAEDDKVCPICQTLDGSVFEVDDPDVPEPDSDTHPNCRCMLRLAELF
jgi:SPP1 gp7 family putative phage head morphogenesis protein